MLCDAGCAEPLANVIPAQGLSVAADPTTAQMAQRIDRLERRIRVQGGQLAAARADAERALGAARSARSVVAQLESRVSSLADESRSSPGVARWVYAGWLLAGVLVGALALLVLRRRRARPSPPAPVAGWHPSDEELQEVLSSERGNPR